MADTGENSGELFLQKFVDRATVAFLGILHSKFTDVDLGGVEIHVAHGFEYGVTLEHGQFVTDEEAGSPMRPHDANGGFTYDLDTKNVGDYIAVAVQPADHGDHRLSSGFSIAPSFESSETVVAHRVLVVRELEFEPYPPMKPTLGCGKDLAFIGERFELECVAGGVEHKHG